MREGGWYTELDLISRKGRAQRQRRKPRKKNGQYKNIKPIFISDSEERTIGKEVEPYDCLWLSHKIESLFYNILR